MAMNQLLPKLKSHFTHSSTWAEIWLKSKGQPHTYFVFESQGLRLIVYQYPLIRDQVFWLINSFGQLLDIPVNADHLTLVMQDLVSQAKSKKNVVFVKTYFNPDFVESIFESITNVDNSKNDSVLVSFLARSVICKVIKPKINMQNNSTILLDLTTISRAQSESFDETFDYQSDLGRFMDYSKNFWSKTSTNVRRYSKKSLQQGWKIEVDEDNFEAAFDLLEKKSKELNFFLHSRDIVRTVVNSECGHLICIKNSSGEICGCWVGIGIENTMLYWYGANNQQSLDQYGQYLMHLTAIALASKLGCQLYDLGGYSPTLGFGKFKELYKGRIFEPYGDYDFVIKSGYYRLDKLLVWVKDFRKKVLA
jgi:lipid II:glycine glycyltransferase (peptidoglycan interpeptide bridge formation enzyme)